MANAKIFGIGLSKTGTSSLAQALQLLGFKTKDYMGIDRYVAGDLSSVDMETVLAHEALTDTPIPSFYRQFDARFPGSKFILTVRDRDGWLKSCRKQFSERFAAAQSEAHKRLFEDLYGTDVFEEDRFEKGYNRFVAEVLEYFENRPADLLVLNVAAGEGWEKLCPFVGRPIPDAPFPKANVTQVRWIKMEELVSIAEKAGAELLKGQASRAEPVPGVVGSRASSAARRVSSLVLNSMLGRDATESALRSAHRALVAGLRRLRPEIPILSPLGEVAPYAERKHWNHFWLIDPLDGREAFAHGGSDFSINIALVEDGRPIYGVVHVPARRLTYFGRLGKGAYRKTQEAEGTRLPDRQGREQTADPQMAVDAPGGAFVASACSGSLALDMCAVLERPLADFRSYPAAPEWKTAAAVAVLQAAGLSVRACAALEVSRYNTPDLSTSPISVDAAAACATQAAQ